jgi:hypothetical protein
MVLRRILTALLLSLLAAAPLAATKVNVKYAAADYAGWKTWAFENKAKQRTDLEMPGRLAARDAARAAVTEFLAAKGYEQAADGETADFRIAIDGAMRDVFDARDIHSKVTDHVAFVMEGGSSSYKEGTLLIRVLDGASGELVWTGWVDEKVKNPENPGSQIRKVIKKILRKFPPDSP